MKILAVDDDPIFMEVLVAMLRSFGEVNVTTAGSPVEVLARLQTPHNPFECILLDLQMPEMDGVELCAAIRALEAYRRVPIIMITSVSARRSIDAAFTAGATDYVTKPLDLIALKARIGMVARLVEERRCIDALTRSADARPGTVPVEVDFQTPILIPEFDRGMEYLALENYLLTLGMKGILAVSAVAIRVENAASIFSRTSRQNFVGMLGDVAAAIADAVKTDDMMIAYAGSGVFVGVFHRPLASLRQDLETMINTGLADFESVYVADRLPLPQVRVGHRVRSSFFSSAKPTRILERALAAAHQFKLTRSDGMSESAA